MNKKFFIMENKHVESCGTPPIITNENSNKYFGYFENEYGEQWVFVDIENNKSRVTVEILAGIMYLK